MKSQSFFALCPRGLEGALAQELSLIGAVNPKSLTSGVAFQGPLELAYRVNLWSRLASRVLLLVGESLYQGVEHLYIFTQSISWEEYFGAHQTIRVDVAVQGLLLKKIPCETPAFCSTSRPGRKWNKQAGGLKKGLAKGDRSPIALGASVHFALLRVKDAIVDRFREKKGCRPTVDCRAADVRVFAFIGAHLSLYLDFSGESLFKRGWRVQHPGAAPMKEHLAAGVLSQTSWSAGAPLFDPFCGTGTLLIEAAQRAGDIAPGLQRRFGFQCLSGYDAQCWRHLQEQAQDCENAGQRRLKDVSLFASDCDPKAVQQVLKNVKQAGLPPGVIRVKCCHAAHIQRPTQESGWVVSNPPYGQRLQATMPRGVVQSHGAVMRDFGGRLRDQFGGWSAWLLSADTDLPRQVGMAVSQKLPLWNGAISCWLFQFNVFPTVGRESMLPVPSDRSPLTSV